MKENHNNHLGISVNSTETRNSIRGEITRYTVDYKGDKNIVIYSTPGMKHNELAAQIESMRRAQDALREKALSERTTVEVLAEAGAENFLSEWLVGRFNYTDVTSVYAQGAYRKLFEKAVQEAQK